MSEQKTMRVRIAVVTTVDGEWVAWGCDGHSDETAANDASAHFDFGCRLRTSFIEAVVPLPSDETIAGEVVT